MSDRANVVINARESYKSDAAFRPLFLYTHWGGTELPETLQRALAKRWRWDDESYLTRIILCEMVKGSEDRETGCGISLRQPDNEYPYLRVNPESQTVTVDFDPVRKWRDVPNRTFSFEDYIAIPDVDWVKLGYHDAEDT